MLAYVGLHHNLKDLKDLKDLQDPKGPRGIPSHASLEDRPLDTRREPSALEGWILELLYCDPKGRRACLRILSTEGRGVRLCWECQEKQKDLKGNL